MIDLSSDEHMRDPYPSFTRLLEYGLPYWDDASSSWYTSTFEDVHQLLGSSLLAARGVPAWVYDLPPRERDIIQPVEEFYSRWLVFSDRDDHIVWALVRGLVTPESTTEEALRFNSPFHFAPRRAAADIDLRSEVITEGDRGGGGFSCWLQ